MTLPARGVVASLAGLALVGCSAQPAANNPNRAGSVTPTSASVTPAALHGSLLTADILVTSARTIQPSIRAKVARLPGVAAVLPLSVGALSANGRTLTVAAGDPETFRRFTPVRSAQADAVWARVADGEVAVDPSLPRAMERPNGYLTLGTRRGAPRAHIGAYAPLVKQITAFVDPARGAQLGLPLDNALLVSTGEFTPSAVRGRLLKTLHGTATVQTLALEFDVDVPQTAVLSGSSVAAAAGSFTYVPHANGTVTPDPA